MRRRRKSVPTSPTDNLATRRRRILMRATSSLLSSESSSLQSLPRTMGVVRGAVKGCGWSSTIQHPVGTPLLPLAAELPRQVGFLLVQTKNPRYSSREGGAGLYSRDEEMPKERYVWVYPNIVFAYVCENRHR